VFVVFLFIVLVVLVYGFLFGPLFPYSPVKFGFSKLELKRGTVFYPKETVLSRDYFGLDSLISETEAFYSSSSSFLFDQTFSFRKRKSLVHKLQFKKKVKVIVCATKGQYKRFSTQSAHACAIQTGTIIYINPSIKNTGRDLTGFLKHELSHAILYQNTSLFKAFKLKRWLVEGLAIYYGNSHHYYRGDKFRKLAIDEGYFFNLLDDKAEPENIPGDIKHLFIYGEYRAFMEYLIKTYGLETILKYTAEYIKAPKKKLFKTLLGISLDEAFARFREEIINGRAS
jgi:hypothetical protein